jgi:hypothetical protein
VVRSQRATIIQPLYVASTIFYYSSVLIEPTCPLPCTYYLCEACYRAKPGAPFLSFFAKMPAPSKGRSSDRLDRQKRNDLRVKLLESLSNGAAFGGDFYEISLS